VSALHVVIVGAPRSGTYWVVDLLKSRFSLQIPSETHFIPLFARYLWLWGDLSKASNRARLLHNIYEFIQLWTPRSSRSEEYVADIRQLSLLRTLDSGRAEQVIAASSDYPSLVEALFSEFASLNGETRSGDKSAHYRVTNPAEVFELFPEARMLHVVRDGRDVAMSWMRQWFGPASLHEAAVLWQEHVAVNRVWGKKHAERYHEVRYEDLAEDEEGEIAKLAAFLDIEAHNSTSGGVSELASALAKTGSHSNMLHIDPVENVQRWRNEMSARDIEAFESIAAAALVDAGYELSSNSTPPVRTFRRRLSLHHVRVLAKVILPLVLGVCSRLGFSLLPLLNRRFGAEWRSVDLTAGNSLNR